MPIRDADDRAAARLQDSSDLLDGVLGFVEMLDRPHRVDRVEGCVAEWQRAHVTDGTVQRASPAGTVVECAARLPDDRFGNVDTAGQRTALLCPRENPRILRLVPQVGLEYPQALQRREVVGKQTLFVARVITRRGGPTEVGKALADVRPEMPVRGPWRHCWSLPIRQFHAPTANDNDRGSPLPITAPAGVGASSGWKTSW